MRLVGGGAAATALTVRSGCASGLAAAVLGIEALASGAAHAVLAGGFESASQAPHLALGLRRGLRLGGGTLLDAARLDGPVAGPAPAGPAAADGAGSSRWAGPEPRAAPDPGSDSLSEVFPVTTKPQGGGPAVPVHADDDAFPLGGTPEGPRPALADGAAAFVVAAEAWARQRGLSPMCRIRIASNPAVSTESAAWLAADLPDAALEALRRTRGSRGGTGGGPLREVDSTRRAARDAAAPIALPGHAPGADGARLIVALAHAAKNAGATGLALAGDASGTILGVRLEP
jgi:acetyl-CoA C-acetyltransferase